MQHTFWEFSLLRVDALGMMGGWVKIVYRAGAMGCDDPLVFADCVLNRDTFHMMGVRVYDVAT